LLFPRCESPSLATRRACNMQALGGSGIAGQVNAFVIV
jgi:hypothetical protein